ncbi:Homoserine/homoserine lactone efflux protein [Clavibacter michiganensis]|nr:Homoserine/homoserine lactone efflux protein [Clavibacter michiganensis]
MILLFLIPPGPDMAYMLGVGLQGGPRAAVKAISGIATGMSVYAAAVVSGLGQIVSSNPALLDGIKLVGAAYLIWLGYGTFRDARKHVGDAAEPGGRNWYARGLIISLTNPKIMLFFIAVLPQFLGSASNANAQLAMLGAINVLTEFLLYGSLGVFAARFSERFKSNGRAQFIINCIAGSVFVGLAVFIVVEILVTR